MQISRDTFYNLVESGLFDNQRVELIAGEIIAMPPMQNFHFVGVKKTERALESLFGQGYLVRAQGTLDLSPHSVVDPDVAVVEGDLDQQVNQNPTTALLIVEVSETTLRSDHFIKASLYAASGIQDYWILNLVDRQLEIYRDPVPDTTAYFGFSYSTTTIHGIGDSVSPLAMLTGQVTVASLLP